MAAALWVHIGMSDMQGKLDTEALLADSGISWTSIRPVYIYGKSCLLYWDIKSLLPAMSEDIALSVPVAVESAACLPAGLII